MAYKFNPFTGNFDDVVDPSGSTTQVQFNDEGVFGGSPDLTWDKIGKALGVGGDIAVSGNLAVSGVTTIVTDDGEF
jgi:hypothetical protein